MTTATSILNQGRRIWRRATAAFGGCIDGYIEAAGPLNGGVRAVMGWAPAALFSDGEKPVAILGPKGGVLVAAGFHRGDLPEGNLGFAGVILGPATEGKPDDTVLRMRGADGKTINLAFAHNFYERTSQDILLVAGSHGAAPSRVALVSGILSDVETGETPTMPSSPSGIEEVFILPGFGAFVKGWVLSGGRRLERIEASMGSVRLQMDPGTLVHSDRPDLENQFGDTFLGFMDAGFSAICLGPLTGTDDPIRVKLRFDNGESETAFVAPRLPFQLSRVSDFEALATNFHYLPETSCAADMARAAREVLQTSGGFSILKTAETRARNLVLLLPPDPHDSALLLDDLQRALADFPGNVSVTLALQTHVTLRKANSAAAYAEKRYGAAVRVVSVKGGISAVLPDVIGDNGGEALVYVDDGARPTEAGWHTIVECLSSREPPDAPIALMAGTWVGGFIWTQAAYLTWARARKPTLLSPYIDDILEVEGARPVAGCLQPFRAQRGREFLYRLETAVADLS